MSDSFTHRDGETTTERQSRFRAYQEERQQGAEVARKRAAEIAEEDAGMTAARLFVIYCAAQDVKTHSMPGNASNLVVTHQRNAVIRDIARGVAAPHGGETVKGEENRLLDALSNLLYLRLEARVLEADMEHQVERITDALVIAGANRDLIEVAYAASHGMVKVLRQPSSEPASPELSFGSSEASATGKWVGLIMFTREGFEYHFLGTPAKARRTWRSNDHLRSTKRLDTLLKNIAKQFYVPSTALTDARVELREVRQRLSRFNSKVHQSERNATTIYNSVLNRAREPSLYGIVREVTDGSPERFDYLLRKMRTHQRFLAFISPLIDERRARQDVLQDIVRREEGGAS